MSYTKLDIYHISFELFAEIHHISFRLPKHELYELGQPNQMFGGFCKFQYSRRLWQKNVSTRLFAFSENFTQ